MKRAESVPRRSIVARTRNRVLLAKRFLSLLKKVSGREGEGIAGRNRLSRRVCRARGSPGEHGPRLTADPTLLGEKCVRARVLSPAVTIVTVIL